MNNTEKALEFINTLDQSKKEVRTIKSAVLKQIIHKTVWSPRKEETRMCPICETPIMVYRPKYCHNCGQKME